MSIISNCLFSVSCFFYHLCAVDGHAHAATICFLVSPKKPVKGQNLFAQSSSTSNSQPF